MENNLGKINDKTTDILISVEIMEGQMIFFSQLIEDMEQYPEGMAARVKIGEVQKQLNALYHTFYDRLSLIYKDQEEIKRLSDLDMNKVSLNEKKA